MISFKERNCTWLLFYTLITGGILIRGTLATILRQKINKRADERNLSVSENETKHMEGSPVK